MCNVTCLNLLFIIRQSFQANLSLEPRQDHELFLPHPSQFIIFYGPIIRRFIRGLLKKVSGLTTVHEVDKAYGVLTLIVFNTVPFRSYTLLPTFLPLLETFRELLFRGV